MPSGTLVRQSTVVGRKKANPYRQRNMKKTTRRGAYRRGAKKAMMIRRAPFVETKSKTSEDLVDQFGLPTTTTFFQSQTRHKHINPDVFTCWSQGNDEAQCLGRQVYIKYLKRKLKIRFPQPPFQSQGIDKAIPNVPQNLELIWGFVPMPLNLTGHTNPLVYDATLTDINKHINDRVVDYFNDRADFLRFIPKKAATIRIIGRRKVRPDMRHFAQMSPQLDSNNKIVGTIPDYQTSLYWPMMKKLHLEKSNALHSTNAGLYPNYSWLPFCVLYNRDYEDILPENRTAMMPSVAYNDVIYFTDS